MICSLAHSPSQQSLSSGDLLPEMMESEKPPPASPPRETDNPGVSSQRISPDPQRPEGNSLAAQSPGFSAPQEIRTLDFGQPKNYLLASADQEKSSTTTPQGRPSQEVGKQGEAFRSPSSPEEDPPKKNFVEKGYEPDSKTYVSVVLLRKRAGHIY